MQIMDIPVTEVQEKIVAIVRFGPSGYPSDGMKAGEYFQVTIDPKCVSSSGKFIRFGHNPGDELIGWQKADALSLVEVLGVWEDETPPVLTYGNVDSVKFMGLLEEK